MIPYLPKQIGPKGRKGPAKNDLKSIGRWFIDWHLALKYTAIIVVALSWLVGHFGGYVQNVGITICASNLSGVAL